MRATAYGRTLLAVAWLACAGTASAAPELSGTAGTTLAVTGKPGTGGASTSFGVRWPVEDRYSFGVVVFADDLGTGLTELRDPNTGGPLGTVASTHRWAFGAEWRVEAGLVEAQRWRVECGGGLGYGRQEQDARGETRGAISGVVVSGSASLLRKASRGHAFGPTISFRRGFSHGGSDPDRTMTWGSAAFEWRWRGGPKE